MRALIVALCTAVLFAADGDGQSPDADLSIALVTFGPGFRAWEHFGHNALWVRQPSRNLDWMYNYGLFDLQGEDFVPLFIRGRMDYEVGAQSPRSVEVYLRENRSVWVQELNLSTAQAVELRDYLAHNVTPPNHTYRYHYYYDNCSTRIRDALDHVLDGALLDQTDTGSGSTFRFHTQRLTSDDIPLYTGLLIGLANPVDREMTIWEEMFLPIAMRERVRDITIVDDAGNRVPLVRSERTINEDPRYDGRDGPPRWMVWYLLAGLLFAVPLHMLGKTVGGRGRELGFAAIGTLWSLVVGTGGAVLAFLWILTDHSTSYWNENLFFFNPFLLGLAVTTPLLALGVRWAIGPAIVCARIVMLSGLVGLAIQVLPGFDQVNAQVIALVLPSNIALTMYVLLRAIPDIQEGPQEPELSTA